MKRNVLKKVLILMMTVLLLPVYTACKLSNTPKEAVPASPDPELTISSTTEAPTVSVSQTTTTTTTAPTTVKRFFGKVTADVLNVRKSASADSDVLDQLQLGDEVEVLGKKGDFFKIKTASIEGFCAKDYIELRSGEDKSPEAKTEQSISNNTEETNANKVE